MERYILKNETIFYEFFFLAKQLAYEKYKKKKLSELTTIAEREKHMKKLRKMQQK